MKKTTLLTAVIATAMLLSACQTTDDSSTSDLNVTEPTSQVDTSSAPDDSDVPIDPSNIESKLEIGTFDSIISSDDLLELSRDELAQYFLEALMSGNGDAVEQFLSTADTDTNAGQFDYLSGVKFNSISVTAIDDTDYDSATVYDVILDVSESSSDKFPIGISEWKLSISAYPMPAFANWFAQADVVREPTIDTETKADAVMFCQEYIEQVIFRGNYDNTAWQNAPTADILHVVRHTAPRNDDGYTDLVGINKYIADRFGYNEIQTYPEIYDILKENCYVETTDAGVEMYRFNCEHGSNTVFSSIESISESNGKCTVTYNFYSDYAYFNKCATAEFTFEENSGTSVMRFTGVNYKTVTDYSFATLSF